MILLFTGLRYLLGLILIIFGLNGFLHFYAIPETTEASARFQQALWESNYLMYMVKATEVACGLLLLLNRFVFASLLFLLPVTINIFMVDLLLQPQFLFMGTFVFTLHIILLTQHRTIIREVFKK